MRSDWVERWGVIFTESHEGEESTHPVYGKEDEI